MPSSRGITMKDYIFHWDQGGFNTVYASSLEEAKAKIIEQWGDHDRLNPVMNTVREVSEKELNSWYRLFD